MLHCGAHGSTTSRSRAAACPWLQRTLQPLQLASLRLQLIPQALLLHVCNRQGPASFAWVAACRHAVGGCQSTAPSKSSCSRPHPTQRPWPARGCHARRHTARLAARSVALQSWPWLKTGAKAGVARGRRKKEQEDQGKRKGMRGARGASRRGVRRMTVSESRKTVSGDQGSGWRKAKGGEGP
jgi:hypothetical protein